MENNDENLNISFCLLTVTYTAKNAPVVTILLQACYKLVGIWRQSEIDAHVVIRCRDRLVARCLQTCYNRYATTAAYKVVSSCFGNFVASLLKQSEKSLSRQHHNISVEKDPQQESKVRVYPSRNVGFYPRRFLAFNKNHVVSETMTNSQIHNTLHLKRWTILYLITTNRRNKGKLNIYLNKWCKYAKML